MITPHEWSKDEIKWKISRMQSMHCFVRPPECRYLWMSDTKQTTIDHKALSLWMSHLNILIRKNGTYLAYGVESRADALIIRSMVAQMCVNTEPKHMKNTHTHKQKYSNKPDHQNIIPPSYNNAYFSSKNYEISSFQQENARRARLPAENAKCS